MSFNPQPLQDWSNATNAAILAHRIELTWQQRGFKNIRVWTETVAHHNDVIYVVRSNMKNGIPPR